MIEELAYRKKNIFDVELSEDKRTLTLTEACDHYYDAFLTRAQVIELANDFLRIAEGMTD